MKKRKVLCYAAAAIVIGFLILMAWPESAPPRPELALVSVEPAEMRNESGAALWLVTFNVSHQQGTVLDIGEVIQTRTKNGSSGMRGNMAGISDSTTQAQAIILVPVGTTSCRISLKYAETVVLVSTRISSYLLQHLPAAISRPIIKRVGWWWTDEHTGPGKWHKVSLELPLPPGDTDENA